MDNVPCDKASVGQINPTSPGGEGTIPCDLRRGEDVNPTSPEGVEEEIWVLGEVRNVNHMTHGSGSQLLQ